MDEKNGDDWDISYPDHEDKRIRDKIFLNKVPYDLTEAGIRNMCERYGKIKKVYRPDRKLYAFVQFESST